MKRTKPQFGSYWFPAKDPMTPLDVSTFRDYDVHRSSGSKLLFQAGFRIAGPRKFHHAEREYIDLVEVPLSV